MRHACLLSGLFFSGVLSLTAAAGETAVKDVEAVLDDFHAAATAADEERYFSHFAASGVFFGTDAGERWTRDQFRGYAHPHFSQGKGWTYHPRDRHVAFSADGATAWFDELLDNAKYGECRGTGVLQRYDGEWKIEQYHLTIPIPNELAAGFVDRIREFASEASPAAASEDGER